MGFLRYSWGIYSLQNGDVKMKRAFVVLALLVIGVGVIGAQGDLATYEGDGFSFEYPAAWVEVDVEDGAAVQLSPDAAVVVESEQPSALLVTVQTGFDLGADSGPTLAIGDGVPGEVLMGLAAGAGVIVDILNDGFGQGGAHDDAVIEVELVGEVAVVYAYDGWADRAVVAFGTGPDTVLIYADAPSGTLDEWRVDFEALVTSVVID